MSYVLLLVALIVLCSHNYHIMLSYHVSYFILSHTDFKAFSPSLFTHFLSLQFTLYSQSYFLFLLIILTFYHKFLMLSLFSDALTLNLISIHTLLYFTLSQTSLFLLLLRPVIPLHLFPYHIYLPSLSHTYVTYYSRP